MVLMVMGGPFCGPPAAAARAACALTGSGVSGGHSDTTPRSHHQDHTHFIGQTPTFPHAWVQTCIVPLIRASLRYVNYRDLKKVTTALRPIYTAANADQALIELDRFDSEWGQRYPATVRAWRDAWEHVTPFLSLPDELRRAVYTTNTIEGLHRQIRKAIKTRGHFPDQQAATKLIYLAIIKANAKWQRPHLDRPTRRTEDPLRKPLPGLTTTTTNHSPRPHTQFAGQSLHAPRAGHRDGR